MLSMSEGLSELIIMAIVAGIISYAGFHFMKLNNTVSEIRDFMVSYTQKHSSVEREVAETKSDIKSIQCDIKRIDEKLNNKNG